jgi:hypothetical protein
LSDRARRRDGRNTARTAQDDLPTSRRRWVRHTALSGAAARRLLDGGDDGPSPLPQLLAAATAPGTAAELQDEAAARAAFRSSADATRVLLGGPRKARARAATTIVTAKIIAALALTAGTAGGVALAAKSDSAHLQQSPAVSNTDTARVRTVSPSGVATSGTLPSTQASDGATRSDSSTAPGDAGEAAGDSPGGSPGPEAAIPGVTGRCAALCTTAAEDPVTPSGQPGQPAGGSQAGNNDNPDNSDNPEEGNANNGNSSKTKNTNNGNSSKEKTNNGNNAGGNGQGKQAGTEKGSNKKTDASTPTTT